MPETEMRSFELYLRHTNTDGQSHVQWHQVWDKEKFIAAREAETAKLNADVKGDAPRKAKVEHITAEQYAKERK